MTLATGSGIYNSFDIGTTLENTDVRDVSQLMFTALNTHPGSLLSMIASASPVHNRKHEWVEQDLNPGTVTYDTTDGDIDGSASTTRFDTGGNLNGLKVGDFLKNKTQNIPEIMQVTAITDESNVTVERGYGATVGSTAHADTDVFEIIPAAQEGSSIGDDMTRDRTTRYNYTQIFDTAIKISRTMLNTQMYNVTDEFANSLMNRTIELKNKINYAMLNSVAKVSGGAPSSTTYGSIHGIIPMLMCGGNIEASTYTSSSAGTVIDPTTSLTYDALSDLIGVCAIQNGNRDGNYVVATGQAQYENIASWPDSQVRRQYSGSGQQFGAFVDSVMTKQGISAKVVLEPDVPIGHLLVLDTNRIRVAPLQNSAMLMYIDELGTSGNDYKQARLVAEWTLEMHNADKAHGIMNALT